MKVTVTLAVRCLHSTREPVMEILSLTTSTILAQDSKNWPICMERNQILTTRWRHLLRLPHCHRSRGVRKFWISRQKLFNSFGGKFIMSCFNEKSKTWSHLFVCFLNPHCYIFTMCDLTEIIIATTFLFYTKKNTIQLVKDLKLHKKNLLPSQIYRAVKMVGNVSFKWLVLNLAFLNPLPCLFLEEWKKNHKMAALF